MDNENANTPAVETPVIETPVTPAVVTPVVQTPAPAVVVPDGYVKAEDVETERTARTAAETARVEAETRATAAEARARATEIKSAAQALGFHDPADAEKFVGAEVSADKIAETLAEVLKGKSYLAKAAETPAPVVTPTSPTNPARTASQSATFTQAQIGDRAFWAANKEQIILAMREGRISA